MVFLKAKTFVLKKKTSSSFEQGSLNVMKQNPSQAFYEYQTSCIKNIQSTNSTYLEP